jgi:hypothetical protein
MLDEAGTTLTQGRPPIGAKGLGVKLMASRTKPATVFAALHEPYNGPAAEAPAAKFTRIAQTEGALATGIGNDRVLLALADGAGKEQTVTGNGESFTFTDFGFVRVGKDKVEVTGQVKSAQVKVTGSPKLIVNGTERPYKPAKGMVIW